MVGLTVEVKGGVNIWGEGKVGRYGLTVGFKYKNKTEGF